MDCTVSWPSDMICIVSASVGLGKVPTLIKGISFSGKVFQLVTMRQEVKKWMDECRYGCEFDRICGSRSVSECERERGLCMCVCVLFACMCVCVCFLSPECVTNM